MNGDAIGLVLIVSVQSVGQVEEKMADVVSKFLGKHIEELYILCYTWGY